MARLAPVSALAALATLLAASPAAGADDPGVLKMEIAVGQSAPIGPPPVRNLICDDGSVVAPVETDGGPALKALRTGTTLCSFTDSLSVRRTYRVVVKAPGGGGPGSGGP
jgi:hypothetical protein